VGPLPVLQTLRDKEPFYRRGDISEGTGDCPLSQASALGDAVSDSRRYGFRGPLSLASENGRKFSDVSGFRKRL
jgi:hypothetical protein